MDPSFVQHSLTDLSARFAGYLIFILAYSTAISGGVSGTFQLFGVDVTTTKIDNFLVGFLGMLFAMMLDFNMFFYIAGLTNGQLASSVAQRAAEGSPSAWFPPGFVIFVCNAVTGLLVIGGKKTITSVAEEFGTGVQSIKNAIKNRNGSKE